MNTYARQHISPHPLRLAFYLHAGWFWYRWWEREALAAIKTLELQWAAAAHAAAVGEVPAVASRAARASLPASAASRPSETRSSARSGIAGKVR